ncbi:hypothetical protein STEG23_017823 [Scotinomys teguina]
MCGEGDRVRRRAARESRSSGVGGAHSIHTLALARAGETEQSTEYFSANEKVFGENLCSSGLQIACTSSGGIVTEKARSSQNKPGDMKTICKLGTVAF